MTGRKAEEKFFQTTVLLRNTYIPSDIIVSSEFQILFSMDTTVGCAWFQCSCDTTRRLQPHNTGVWWAHHNSTLFLYMQWYVYSHILAALISRVSGLRNWYPANPVLSWYPANPVPFDTPRIRFHIDIPRIRYLYWYPANPASILIPRESGSIDIPRIRLLYWYPANPVSMVMSRESGFYLVTPWTRFSSIDTPRIRSPHPVILRIRIRFLYIFMDTVCEPRESNSCLSRTANPVAISNPWLLIPSLISRESGLLYN